MAYFAIPLTDKRAVLAKIFATAPENVPEYPFKIDTVHGDPLAENILQDHLHILEDLNSLLFNSNYHDPLSDFRFSEVIIGSLGVWVNLHNQKHSLNEKFNGWFVVNVQKVEDFGELTVANVQITKNEDGVKAVKFTVDDRGFKYDGSHDDYFEEILTEEGRLPKATESCLQYCYPLSVINLIHDKITLGSLVA